MEDEKQFTQGFNHGYLLAKFLPRLLSKVVKNLNTTSIYFQGFFSGSEQYEIENSKDQLKDIRKIRLKTDKEQERDL